MNVQKRDVAKHIQKGTLAAGETGPLFPRLHVKETEKAGPKGPPRNKMALYEQFTVPSHCFVQQNQTSSTTMYQQNQYGSQEYGYSYIPYYMASVPYTGLNHGIQVYAQPSHGTSSSGISNDSGVVNDDDSHRKTGKASPAKHVRGLTQVGVPRPKNKKANYIHAPNLSPRAIEAPPSLHNAPSDMERPCTTDITENTEEALSTQEVRWERTVPEGQRCSLPMVENLTDSQQRRYRGQLKPSALKNSIETLDGQNKGSVALKSSGSAALPVHSNIATGTSIEPKDSEEIMTIVGEDKEDKNYLSSGNGVDVAHTNDEACRMYVFETCSTALEKVDGNSGVLSVDLLAKPDSGTYKQLKNIRNENANVPLPQSCGPNNGGGSVASVASVPGSNSSLIIKPNDVIPTIGQKHFWKARKTLLRQQRIFSDQVFQLHKLIKVQQLLAGAPGMLIDEAMDFETIEECGASVPLAKCASNVAQKKACDFKEGSKGASLAVGNQPKITVHCQIHSDGAGRGSNQSMPEFSLHGVSTWGYPSLGQWVAPMAAQGRPLPYTLPPGSLFGLPYMSAMPGPMSPMISYGIPFSDQRQGLSAEMGSNYRSSIVHEGNCIASQSSSHVPNDQSGSWYCMQYGPKMHTTGPTKDASTGSGASVNKSPAAVQTVKTSRSPGICGTDNQSGMVSTNAFDRYVKKHATSSRSVATRLTYDPASSILTTSALKEPGLNHGGTDGVSQNLDLASGYMCDNAGQFEWSVGGREEPDMRLNKEGVCMSVDGRDNEHISDSNENAMDLFPLVSLSSNRQLGKREAVNGQGCIIRAVPRRAVAASESAAGILLSLQQERQK